MQFKDYQRYRWFFSSTNKLVVGGKNASLGEMYNNLVSKGVNIPNGFAITADAYFYFLKVTGLARKIENELKGLDIHNLKMLQVKGKAVREMILASTLPENLQKEITSPYR